MAEASVVEEALLAEATWGAEVSVEADTLLARWVVHTLPARWVALTLLARWVVGILPRAAGMAVMLCAAASGGAMSISLTNISMITSTISMTTTAS